jgi:hypothetical protein
MLRGEVGVWWMSLAAIAVLVPGWIVVFLPTAAILRNDLSVMLVQTMIRLFSVAGVALAVKKLRPDLGIVDFFGWLIAFYLLALAVEVALLKRTVAASSVK